MNRCPKCSRLVPHEQWLCDCCYEFTGNEPDSASTREGIRPFAQHDGLKPNPSHRTGLLTMICLGVLLASFLAVAVGMQDSRRPLSVDLIRFGLCGFGLSFFGFCVVVVRAAVRGQFFTLVCGIVLMLLGFVSFMLSAVTAACGSIP